MARPRRPLNLSAMLMALALALAGPSRAGDTWALAGASFSHYSNSGMKDPNPGAETVRLFWAFPAPWLWPWSRP